MNFHEQKPAALPDRHPFRKLLSGAGKIVRTSVELYIELLKVMIPVLFLVRLATEFGLVQLVSDWLSPLMSFIGLPSAMGLVWATTMIINPYAGAIVFLGLLPDYPLSGAQATVLGMLMLLAHSLPVEQRIVQRAGGGFFLLTALRIIGGYLLAYLMHKIYVSANLLQGPVQIHYLPLPTSDTGWLAWAIESSKTLAVIFFIILGLIVLIRLLDILGITKFLTSFLAPVLSFMGISKLACNMTLSGALLGLAFGGALIIKETQSGNLSPKDIFLSLAFLCLCHGIIEDSLFVMALGADISGVLFARVIFTLVIMFVLGKVIHAIPDAIFERYLFRTRY